MVNSNAPVYAYDKATYKSWMLKGRKYGKLRKPSKAIVCYSKALKVKPADSNALTSRAFQYAWIGKFKESLADYNSAISANPKSAYIYRERGCLFGRLKKYNRAVEDFSKSIELNPKVATVYFDRARAYKCLGKSKLARKDLDSALRIYSGKEKVGIKNNTIYFTYGKHDSKLSEKQSRLSILAKAALLRSRGELSGSGGDLVEAMHDMHAASKLEELRPSIEDVFRSVRNEKNLAVILKTYSKLVSMNPENEDNHYNRGIIYLAQGKWKLASQDFEIVQKLSKNNRKTQLQSRIWLVLSRAMLNKKGVDKTVIAKSTKDGKKFWTVKMLRFLNGEITAAQLLTFADSLSKKTQARCVIGFFYQLNGKRDKAKNEFNWVAKSGDTGLDEFVLSCCQYKRLL